MSQFNIDSISLNEILYIFKTYPTIFKKDLVYKSPLYMEPGMIIREGDTELDKFSMLRGQKKKILSLITNGFSNSAIAQKLSISIKTVETYWANIMKMLKIHNLVELVKFSMRN